jgi:flagellar L-ring protein precursor FlgH
MKTRTIAAFLPLLLAACATPPTPQPGVYPGRLPDLELAEHPRPISEGSLYTEESGSELVGDFRGRHLGDVIVVRITESALGTSSADSKLDKTSANELKAPTLLGYENKLKGVLGPDFDPALAYKTANAQNFDGKGETNRAASLTAQVAVRVMAVGTGGRMVVAGTKDITVNREHQTLTLAGIIRPEDVRADNTVASSSIADLTIKYGGTGDVAEMTRQGWFTKLISKVWPF